ncbi:MAG: NAD(P)-binding domain-containing protein [Deltaproteobacteria bacterium]|nr:NAD(P)-binding domain-containing protein [Deltaproteobacteria bacterium]
MTTVVIVAGLVGIALLLSFAWRSLEGAREEAAVDSLTDMAGMGDVVPPSLHPVIDASRCVGSGACVRACPEHDVIAMVEGQARLINPLGCVGHGVCAVACGFEAISLVFGTAERGLELPQVDRHFQTNQPGVYIAGELGGMGLIRNAVSQGAQAAAHIAAGERRAPGGAADVLDVIVVGAGPAGISATLGALDAGLRVAVIEREALGGTILHYPRAKVVMTGALEFPKYGTVKKRTMTKEALVELWEDIRAKTDLPVITGELVEALTDVGDGTWIVRSNAGERRAANVVLALGRRGSPRKLGVPGENLTKVNYGLLEPEVFKDQHVLVVGGGNSAVESAIALADLGGCASVGISYRRTEFARCRGDNKRRIAELMAEGRVRAYLPTNVVRVDETAVSLRAEDGSTETIQNDAIIVQIGGTSPAKLLESFGIRMVTKYGEA